MGENKVHVNVFKGLTPQGWVIFMDYLHAGLIPVLCFIAYGNKYLDNGFWTRTCMFSDRFKDMVIQNC